MRKLAAIVEGHGEVEALPLLIRRVQEGDPSLLQPDLKQSDVIRVGRSKVVKQDELERAVELAARKVGRGGAVLVLLDADDDLGCELGPDLLARADREDIDVGVVIAVREYESWFLAAAKSLSGVAGLRQGLTAPASPGTIRGAKEWLGERMADNRSYRPRLHQAKLTAAMDLEALAADRSFRKLEKEVRRLLTPPPEEGTSDG